MTTHKRDFLITTLVLGFLSFLFLATLSAIFIIVVPLNPDKIDSWITEEDSYGSNATFPVTNDSIEMRNYFHNKEMQTRNVFLIFVVAILGGLLALFTYQWIPSLKNYKKGEVFLIGFLVALIVPQVLGRVLPPPVKWFPREITEIREARQEKLLNDWQRAERSLRY